MSIKYTYKPQELQLVKIDHNTFATYANVKDIDNIDRHVVLEYNINGTLTICMGLRLITPIYIEHKFSKSDILKIKQDIITIIQYGDYRIAMSLQQENI